MAGNWWNRTRYRLYAPVYDLVARPLERGRERAIERLDIEQDDRVLVLGCGTGLDLNYLPTNASVTALDVTETMVRRTEARADGLGMDIDARVGDARSVPFEDGSFDAVLLHLILSVAPDPEEIAAEAARVVASDGRVSIYDKSVPTDTQPSFLRRAANPLARIAFADLDRSLGPMIDPADLELGKREEFLHGFYTVTTAEPRPTDG